jgi:succinoglycan biosynthesis transport protein ExoP
MADSAETENPYVSSGDENSVDVEGIIADFRRYFRVFIAVFVVVFIAIFVPTLMKTPMFTSTSSVMIGNPNEQAALPGQPKDDQPTDAATIDSEVEILQSNAVAERVMNDLHLDQDPEFNPALGNAKPSLMGQVKSFVTLAWLRSDNSAAAIGNAEVAAKLKKQVIINNIMGQLDVKRVGLTKIINVSYTSASKEKAAMIADDWAKVYLEQKIEAKDQANNTATGWLSSRIEDLRKQVEDSDRAVQEYKIANNLMSAGSTTLTEQELSDLNRQLATVQVDRAESAARLSTARDQLRSGSNGGDVGEALNSPVVSGLRSQQAQISNRLAEMQTRYGPMHPEVVKAKNQLADIDKQIDAEIQRIMSNLEAQDQIQQQRTGSLAGSVGRARGQLASNSKAMVKLNELQMNADSARSLYESYLDRYRQTASQSGGQSSNASMVTQAKIPTSPSSPKMALAVIFALAGASLSAGGSVLVRRAFDSGLTTSHDVERKLGVQYLTGVPALSSTLDGKGLGGMRPHEYVVDKPLSVFAEGFRSLRASLLYNAAGKEVKVVAITSALPGEGKTTTSVCLALTMAVAGSSVVVVDCDLRRRSINELFGEKPEKGLVEVLDGTATLDEVLITDKATGLKILPLSQAATTTRDLFGSDAMDKLLDVLRGRFDLVVLDTAPVLPVVDTRILARKADIVAVLVRWRHTPAKAAQRTIDLLHDVQVNIGGVALTQIDVQEQAKYGYGDVGYYYKAYKGYYSSN